MRIRYEGELGFGVTAKDLILATIGQMGVDGAQGHVVEFAGPCIEALSMEGRMTICNMTIEGGGRAGMVAPDETTFAWVRDHGGEVDPAWSELYMLKASPSTRSLFVATIHPDLDLTANTDADEGKGDRVAEPDQAVERFASGLERSTDACLRFRRDQLRERFAEEPGQVRQSVE